MFCIFSILPEANVKTTLINYYFKSLKITFNTKRVKIVGYNVYIYLQIIYN